MAEGIFMDWREWAAAIASNMGWLHWLGVTIASSAVVGLAVRHLTKTAISHTFTVQLEKVKFEHAQKLQVLSNQSKLELERVKADIDAYSRKELEYIKAEIALFANTAANEVERDKALYMTVANVRATSYPKLVSLLRRMKRQFEGLHYATSEGNGGPINLAGNSRRSGLARKAIDELAELEKEFDDELSGVRLFTQRSDYFLQTRVQVFVQKWQGEREIFSVSDAFLRRVIEEYNDDVSYLSEEFYRPEISIPQSGELLRMATAISGGDDDVVGEAEKNRDREASSEKSSARWLASRYNKPRANFSKGQL